MAKSSLPMKNDLVDISGFLPPLDDGDDPRDDDDFNDLVAEIRSGKIEPPEPIRVVLTDVGVRLADRTAWKIWAACRGTSATSSIGLLPKRFIKVISGSLADGEPGDNALSPDTSGSSDPCRQGSTPLKDHLHGNLQPSASVANRSLETRLVASLKPSKFNADIFVDSLSDEAVRDLVEDIKHRGLRVPLEVKPDGTIMDGSRRHRALEIADVLEVQVVVVEGIETEAQEREYIVGRFSSTRQATVRERVNVYLTYREELARQHGRPRGRPSVKDQQVADLYWSPKMIAEEAARKAGFGSPDMADRANSVFKKATEEVKEKLVAGDLTINAAYKTIKKPSKKKGKDKADGSKSKASKAKTNKDETHPDQADDAEEENQNAKVDGDQAEEEKRSSDPQDPDAGTSHAQKEQAEEEGDQENAGEAQNNSSGDANLEDDDAETLEPEPPTRRAALQVVADFATNGPAEQVRKILRVLASRAAILIWIQPEDVQDGLDGLSGLVCEQVELLADEDYQAASEWVKQLVEDLREGLSQHDHDAGDDVLDA